MNPGTTRIAVAVLAIGLSVFLQMPATAKDLGVRGETWTIAEPDLLDVIEARLLELEQSGSLAKLANGARVRARSRIEMPEPVAGIAPATEYHTRVFDPSIEIDRDIRLTDGTLLAAGGTRLNPLAHAPLSRDLLFIDGRRDVEVGWALAHAAPSKIVLLAGRPLDLTRRHGRPFFFDQGGRLSARFGLAATPVLIEQDGQQLRITEVPVRDRGSRP